MKQFQIEKKVEQGRCRDIPKELKSPYFQTKIPEDHHVLLIFDDIGSLGKEGKLGIQLANLSFIVRHLNVSIIELAQRVTLLSTGLSSQADFWIFFCEQNPNERINIYRRIAFCDKKIFWNIFDRETSQVRSWIGIRKVHGRNYFFNGNGFIFN